MIKEPIITYMTGNSCYTLLGNFSDELRFVTAKWFRKPNGGGKDDGEELSDVAFASQETCEDISGDYENRGEEQTNAMQKAKQELYSGNYPMIAFIEKDEPQYISHSGTIVEIESGAGLEHLITNYNNPELKPRVEEIVTQLPQQIISRVGDKLSILYDEENGDEGN